MLSIAFECALCMWLIFNKAFISCLFFYLNFCDDINNEAADIAIKYGYFTTLLDHYFHILFDKCNMSLLNRSINFLKKKKVLTPDF